MLTNAARRKYVAQFEERMNTLVQHPGAGIQTTWRGCIDVQIGHLIRVLRGEVENYAPMNFR